MSALASPAAPLRPLRRVSLSFALGLSAWGCLVAGRLLDALPALGSFLSRCPFKALTSLPCFFCGITRVFLLLGEGALLDALLLAPLPFLLATSALALGVWSVLSRLRGAPEPDEVLGRLLRRKGVLVLGAVSFLALWGYAISRSLLLGAP